MENNDVVIRYSDAELEEFRILIQEKLDKAKEELTFFKEQLSADGSDTKVKGLDDGVGTREKDQVGILAARQQKYIKHLENALLRIQNKIYGICRESGKLISKERLRAVPHATLSVQAKTSRK
ncbi:MAG: TraR/DksA family transcriptional regulator [Saprospiraceae bacterium]